MEFKIFLIYVICTVIFLPSIAAQINQANKGEFDSFEIFAKIDTKLANAVKNIEKYIRSSSFKSFIPLQSTSYHMTIYQIQYRCNTFIPPIKRWYNAKGRTIPNRCPKIPYESLEEPNNQAMCIIMRSLNQPLKIKTASLNIGSTMISLTLEVEAESLQRIQSARRKFADIYGHSNPSMEPINKKLHIPIAYGKRRNPKLNDLNQLNLLTRPFNGGKFSLPSIYLDNGDRYVEFRRSTNCFN